LPHAHAELDRDPPAATQASQSSRLNSAGMEAGACMPNLHRQRFWIEAEKRWVSLRVSTQALRTIEKRGIDVVLAELRASGMNV